MVLRIRLHGSAPNGPGDSLRATHGTESGLLHRTTVIYKVPVATQMSLLNPPSALWLLGQSLTALRISVNKQFNSVAMQHPPAIFSIPDHVLSDIFILGKLEEILSHTGRAQLQRSAPYNPFPEKVSHVCGYFRSLALGSPALWDTVCITQVTPLAQVEAYCLRSSSCPLTILVSLDRDWAGNPRRAESVFEVLRIVVSHASRWLVVSLLLGVEPDDPYSVVDLFGQQKAPQLRSLTVRIDSLPNPGPLQNAVQLPMPFAPAHIFSHGADQISLVRFGGLSVHLMRPPLTHVTVLHLDQTVDIPISYMGIRQLLSTPRALQRLSIYGDLVDEWPSSPFLIIQLPFLSSLRLASTDGALYLGVLQNIDAPRLRDVILKGMIDGDLGDTVGSVTPNLHFPEVATLSLVDSSLSVAHYRSLMHIFPSVQVLRSPSSKIGGTLFSALCLPISTSSTVTSSSPLEVSASEQNTQEATDSLGWPHLRALRLGFDTKQSPDLLRGFLDTRRGLSCPIPRIVFDGMDDGAREARISLLSEASALTDSCIREAVVTGTSVSDAWVEIWEGHILDYGDTLFQ
ncbi:hypothetical protein NMY22_g11093 [Coprinellus aureogranulatus]|nr:hypothetical protein NMY22_g11093 [Coprinellus aureogranulatus]